MFICLKPEQKLVFIGDDCVKDVDFSSVPKDVVSVEFDQTRGLGVVAKRSLDQGLILEDLNSLKEYELILSLARESLEARNNPKTYYSTVARPELELGAPVVVTSAGWPQPADTTEEAPPLKPDDYSKLYWSGRRFIWWCFPPNLRLGEAKESFLLEVDKQAYELLQPTDWYAVRQLETNQLIPENVGLWRASVRLAAQSKISQLQEVTSKVALNTLVKSEAFRLWPPSL
jgi:hypothetical protein